MVSFYCFSSSSKPLVKFWWCWLSRVVPFVIFFSKRPHVVFIWDHIMSEWWTACIRCITYDWWPLYSSPSVYNIGNSTYTTINSLYISELSSFTCKGLNLSIVGVLGCNRSVSFGVCISHVDCLESVFVTRIFKLSFRSS